MKSMIFTLPGRALALGMATAAEADTMQTVPFRCDDGRTISVSFADGRAEVTMSLSLEQQASGSGFSYAGNAGVLSGQGDEVMWESGAGGAVTCMAVPGGAALVGGTWALARVNDLEAATPERHTLTFLPDGTVHLRADCNIGRGAWQAAPTSQTDGALDLGLLAVTRAACADDPFPAMAADLSDVTAYAVENGALRLDAANGAIYTFRAEAG